MLKRLLIANRGEIACRVMRTAKRLGVHCIAVHSEADAGALHVATADEAWCIGPAAAAESYLNMDAILDAAARSGADAIHPGYGFLSENAEFAEACEQRGIVFVGPPASAIRAMGSKSEAKRLMGDAGVPLVPGYHGEDQSPERLREEAERIGWPALLKASAGGGGRGMRVVERAEDFDAALESARRESGAAFGDDAMLIERYVTGGRHVEIQVFADRHDHFVHLFERDCSAQRRHQKVIEEAPAPNFAPETRAAMGEAAVAAARAIGYVGAGTVEFLLAPDGHFWFLEMNTRLQVEHPVTELVTGTDLVEWQLRVASGEPLPRAQDELDIRGHAMEARLCAEDPARGFLPSTGKLVHFRLPNGDTAAGLETAAGSSVGNGVRIDTSVGAGDEVTMHYDPMIAKVIAWGPDRMAAADRLERALARIELIGPASNAGFLRTLVNHATFRAGEVHTRFIEEALDELVAVAAGAPPDDTDIAIGAWAIASGAGEARAAANSNDDLSDDADLHDPHSPWRRSDHWRLNAIGNRIVRLHADDDSELIEVEVRGGSADSASSSTAAWQLRLPSGAELTVRGEPETDGGYTEGGRWWVTVGDARHLVSVVAHEERCIVFRDGCRHTFMPDDPEAGAGGVEMAGGGLTAPMPGRIVSVLVEPGQAVREGEPLLVLEAMKMEHTLTAPGDGTVEEIRGAAGDMVDETTELVVIAAASASSD